MEGFELEEAFKGLQSNPPCTEQGHLQLEQVAQSHVQSDLKCFQGWGIYHLSRQPAPRASYPHCKNSFLTTSLNLSSFSLKHHLLSYHHRPC